MWTIRRNHQHIKPETLTEYMDGRLGAGALVRADRQLASCEACRDELESLWSTVVMLRQLPTEAPRRSFTMVAPPPELVRARPLPPLRLPQWVFAGAASVAAIVLAVLVSADATGLLAPGGRLDSPEAAAPVLSQRAPESALADAGDRSKATDGQASGQALPAAAPLLTDAPAAAAAERAAPKPEPLAMAAEAPVAAEAEGDEPSPAPLAFELDAPVAAGAEAADTQVENGLAADLPQEPSVEVPESSGQQAAEPLAVMPPPETGPGPLQEEAKVPVAGPVSRELPGAGPEGTGAFWRVLEGLVAVAGALFLVGLVWKMTILRRADRR